MDNSPGGHEIKWIAGNGGDIESRGQSIEDLGQQMIDAAEILKSIAEGADGMEGLSVEKIREVVKEDIHKELKEAGEMYKPTGDVLKDYGKALGDVHSGMNAIIEECERLWDIYESKQNALGRITNPFGPPWEPPAPQPDDTDEDRAAREAHEERVATAESEAATALQNFNDEAAKFDAKYNTWDEAYELALERIGNVTDGGIKDSPWDDASGWVEAALNVLAVAGIILAVLCIVIGGPILAILAMAVGILTLIGTIYLATQGRKDGWDVFFAAVGIIPFGKLGVFLKPLSTGQKFGAFFKGFLAIDEFGQLGGQFTRMGSAFSAGFNSGLAPGVRTFNGMWQGFVGMSPAYAGDAGVLARYMGVESLSNANALEVLSGHFGEVFLKGGVNGGRDLADLIGNFNNFNNANTWRDQLARNN